ncbi:hypothetical protein BJ138DRAFT_1084200 [Hygrophoropsis aurantiaca]|uniref:Uncharacterized protein n=1 Tax=Hygrophoropsis aurantiaca TaxID=72124 RepID=A0ACB8AF22_9AGAM|nr:hypothetical protein BJ138DRAFT_1084200 [Hygrophoropsis aurantiaca]
MVKLSLVSPKGNQGVRFFPHLGYLGLTPLKFEGLVRTQLEQDGKPLLSKDISIAVRCYEARQNRLGTVQTNILAEHILPLWKKPDNQEWAEIGDSEHPFRISMPMTTTGPSTTLYFQEYRIYWRIEAILNHIPLVGVGARQIKYFDLPLIRHDIPTLPSPASPLTPPPSGYLCSLSNKPRAPSVRYRVSVPPNPIGPLDIVSITVNVQPLDPSVMIRSATAVVERRIQLSDVHPATSSGPPSPSIPISATSSSIQPNSYFQSHSAPSASTSSSPYRIHNSHIIHHSETSSAASSINDINVPRASASSLSTDNDTRPLLHQQTGSNHSASDRTATHIFAHVESSARFSRDSTGVWKQTLNFSWPDAKSSNRWAVGETLQTDMASVKFFVRVKLIVSSPTSSAESIELEEKELVVVATNESRRQLALSRYNELLYASSRSKSKSPKRSKRSRAAEQLSSPSRSPHPTSSINTPLTAPIVTGSHLQLEAALGHSYKFSSSSSPYPDAQHKSGGSRRPHTSAGPRDKSSGYDMRGYEAMRNKGNRLAVPVRPETAWHVESPNNASSSPRGAFDRKWVEAPRHGDSSTSVSSEGGPLTVNTEHTGTSLLFEKVDQVEIRAWEEELARIEIVSRRSSADMIGFMALKKKSVDRPTPTIRTYLHAEG